MLNRISGLLIAIAGAILYFWIIPDQTESSNFGWLKPSTLPDILSIIMVFLGLLHFCFPTGKAEMDGKILLRLIFIFVLCVASVFLMNFVGFIYIAPILVLIIMILIGERRPLWLFSSIILVPASLWIIVVFVLERSLP
jgi:putative tricarboxylic transport membrane protein